MATPTLFESCTANLDSTSADYVTNILQCVAAGTDTLNSDLSAGINTFYLIYGGALVFIMQLGFAMLTAGSIRAKNTSNVLLWNMLDSCIAGIAYFATGYAFAYGGDFNANNPPDKTFWGTQNFFLRGDVPLAFWFFQFAFTAAISSIVAGTVAERVQMRAYLLYSAMLAGFVYPIVSHSTWSTRGFLSNTAVNKLWNSGAVDLAGSGPVHMTGGVAALVGGIIVGPRIGRFYDKDGNPLAEPATIKPHSVSLMFLGTFALWFGWYGFNPASVLTINTEARASVAALATANTTLAACAGALSAMFTSTFIDYYYLGYHTYDPAYTMNGSLAGLVAITGGCAAVETWAAIIIGIIAGWAYLACSKLMIRLRIDDAVDAIGVHMAGGCWGVLATGLFSKQELLATAYGLTEHQGWFYNGSDFTLMGIQIIEVLFIFGWVSFTMGIFFSVLKYVGWLRADELEEEVGMDLSRHKGTAYNVEDTNEETVKQLEMSRHRSSLGEDISVKKQEEAAVADDQEIEA